MTAEELREARKQAYFADLGRCVVVWAEVELELFDAFRLLTGLSDQRAALLFGRLGTIAPRLDALAKMAREEGGEPGFETVAALLGQLKTKIDLRNMLVHQPAAWSAANVAVRLVPEGQSHSVEIVGEDPGHLRTVASPHSKLAGKLHPVEFADAEMIKAHHLEVGGIRAELALALRGIRQRR